MIFFQKNKEFLLTNSRISYAFRVSPEGILEHLYFGENIGSSTAIPAGPKRVHRAAATEFQGVEHYYLSDTPQEYPVFGTSDTRYPALHAINADGNSTTVLLYKTHQIVSNKPDLKGLPSSRGGLHGSSETLIITLMDSAYGLQVDLHYTIYKHHDVVTRSVEIINESNQPIELHNALSSCLDLPAGDMELLHLRGTWAREFNEQRMSIPAGRFTIDSASGASSNHHNPFIAVMESGTTEAHGWVVGAALMYSGSFAINIEKSEFDAVRVSAGINPFNFKWQLAPGESFQCPEVLQVFSHNGLNGMSQVWHRFIKQHISPPQFENVPRPTYLNSWEAAYFDINENMALELADQAKSLGLEMLVVDDGWFQGRADDTSSLGDWFSDKKKFPNGIESVAAKVQQKGLKFGLWFEPEMVNPDSELYRDHPEWAIQVPHRKLSTGRHQLILDLSHTEVVDYLFERIDQILSCGHIDYIKWDMNRVMTEIGSTALARNQQLEMPHRYMLGLYRLISRLTEKYPDVLFENCASGGNRFDLGMLRYMAQGWVSDMSEPIGRLAIINGASYLFPLSVLASYIGPVPSHQNGRAASLKLRGEVGFFSAARGLSLNVDDINTDRQALKHYVELYKSTAKDLVEGTFYRIQYNDNEVGWQLSSSDGNTVYIGYFHILSAPNLPFRRLHLMALEPDQQYELKDRGESYSGEALMRVGLDMPHICVEQRFDGIDYMDRGDFSSRFLVLFKKD